MYVPPLNLELLQATLDMVNKLDALEEATKHQDEFSGWYQGSWRCESGKCFAGWAIDLGGRQWAAPLGCSQDDEVLAVEGDDLTFQAQLDDKTWVEVATPAAIGRQLLGLTAEEGSLLFAGHNEIDDINSMVGHLLDGKAIDGSDDRW